MFSPSPLTASNERFRDRRLSLSIPDEVLVQHEEQNKQLGQSLQQSWVRAVARFKKETGEDLGDYRSTKDGVLGVLQQQYGSDSKDAKKRDELYGTVEKILNGVELVGATAAQIASQVFGPAQMCFNALDILLSIPRAVKKFADDLQSLFKEIASYLNNFKIYDRIDRRGMLDVALLTSNNEILVTLVDLCMLAWKVIKSPIRTVLGNVFLKNDAIGGALNNFRDLVERQNQLTSTMTLEAVLQSEVLSRQIKQRTARIEDTTKDTNTIVRGLAAESAENKNLKVDRDRILKIYKALDLSEAMVNGPLDELKAVRTLLLEETIALLKDRDLYKAWHENEASRSLLYIGGETSSGKTNVLSALAEDIEERKRKWYAQQIQNVKNKQPRDDRSIYLAYFSFGNAGKGKDRGKFDTPVHTALKVMAAQIARQSTRYATTLYEALDSLQKGQKTLLELWNALKLSDFGAPTNSILYMFFDGLDQVKSSLQDLGTILKMSTPRKMQRHSAGKLKLRVIFTGKPDASKKLSNDKLFIINISDINTTLIRKYVHNQLQNMNIFQDDDQDSTDRREQVLEIIPDTSNGSFAIAAQKLKLLEEAVEEDADSDALMEKLKSATFNTLADEGRKILDRLGADLSDQHREQLKELLIWSIYANRRLDLKELESALYLQRDKKSLEPLKRKIEVRFEEALEIVDSVIYPKDPVEEVVRSSSDRPAIDSIGANPPKISVNVSVENVDEPSVKQFFWDLNKEIADGRFRFSSQVQKVGGAEKLTFSEGVAQFTIISRLLRGLNDDRVRRQATALIKYAAAHLPSHISSFAFFSMQDAPLEELKTIGKGLVNFLCDTESIASAWDLQTFDPEAWSNETNVQAMKDILANPELQDELEPIERRWANKNTGKTLGKAPFLSTMASTVAHKWLTDRSRRDDARECFAFIDEYLELLARPDYDSSECDSISPIRTDTFLPALDKENSDLRAHVDHEAENDSSTHSTVLSDIQFNENSPDTPFQRLPEETLIAISPTVERVTSKKRIRTDSSMNSRSSTSTGSQEDDATTAIANANDDHAKSPDSECEEPQVHRNFIGQSSALDDKNNDTLLGNFSDSSFDIQLVDGSILAAMCMDSAGSSVYSTLDLNYCLTNEWGRLRWRRGGNAFASARGARLTADGKTLKVVLIDGYGGYRSQRIRLDEQISNEDGRLIFLDNGCDDDDGTNLDHEAVEPETLLSYVERVKRAEEWAVSTLKINLDSFALLRLGYTLLLSDVDAAMDYFDRVESDPTNAFKAIGLARAFMIKNDYSSALDSLMVAADIMRAEENQKAQPASDAQKIDYSPRMEVNDLFSCLTNAAECRLMLKEEALAIDLVEEALRYRPGACNCRWWLIVLLCEADLHTRAEVLLMEWKNDFEKFESQSLSAFMLRKVDSFVIGKEFVPIIYACRGTTLLNCIQDVIEEAIEKADSLQNDMDSLNLLYARGLLLACDGRPDSLESARQSWTEAFNIGRDLEFIRNAPMVNLSKLMGMYYFDQARTEIEHPPEPAVRSATQTIEKLKDEIIQLLVPSHANFREADRPTAYITAFGWMTNQFKYSKEFLKQDMTDAIDILSDEDIYNDDTGVLLLVNALFRFGDFEGALSAFSLLDRIETRPRVKSRPKVEFNNGKGSVKSVPLENDDHQPDSGISYSTAFPNSTEADVNKSMMIFCEGCENQFLTGKEDTDMWWCKYCPGVAFCTSCKGKLLQNQLKKYVCNREHEFMLMKHPEYTEDEIKGDNVRIGWRWQNVKVNGRGGYEGKKVVKLERVGGQIIELKEWLEILRKEWDIKKTKTEGMLQQ